jgi:CRISPR type III-associated protein (TIGR04423 family)
MVDGSYRISAFPLEETDASDYTEAVYYPNRLSQVRPEVAQLKFRKYWKEEPDPLCEGMPVLVPAEEVFVGFVLQGKEK